MKTLTLFRSSHAAPSSAASTAAAAAAATHALIHPRPSDAHRAYPLIRAPLSQVPRPDPACSRALPGAPHIRLVQLLGDFEGRVSTLRTAATTWKAAVREGCCEQDTVRILAISFGSFISDNFPVVRTPCPVHAVSPRGGC
ncbi:hypothetical protein C8J57DRAFT_1509441 [Mycena rebaudengoi]|nr:hypothetical protein C8J57DRAFT_1509441 [Mycena rebaudengoi]